MRFAHAQAAGRSAQHGHGRAPGPGAVPHRRRRRTLLRRLVSPRHRRHREHRLLLVVPRAPATPWPYALKRIYFAVLRRRGRPKAKEALARRLLIRLYVMLRDLRLTTTSSAAEAKPDARAPSWRALRCSPGRNGRNRGGGLTATPDVHSKALFDYV